MEKEKKSKLHTPKEILNALHVIQDTCEYYQSNIVDRDRCKQCPLCTRIEDNDTCTITDLEPDNWSIADNPDTTWRAFEK